MRKFLIPTAALGVLALAAVEVAPTIAQDSSPTQFTATATVSPNKAGTKKKPQGVKLTFNAKWVTSGDVEHPIITSGDVNIPKGGLYNGGKFPSCSAATLSHGGPSKCPAKSIMGSGTGDALADTVHTAPKITVVNGGASRIYFWTVLQNPARVQAAVPATIKKDTSGKWSYKVHFDVPESLQIVAGVPITLNTLKVTVGGKAWAKDYIATTSCPSNKKWQYSATANLSTGGSISYNGSTPCK
ncbi:MAG TPA: hypothetical protein VI318_25395 [Baekduia sp.]